MQKPVFVKFDTKCIRQAVRIFGWVQADAQYHQVEFFLFNPFIGGGISYGDILGLRVLFGYGYVTPDETNVGEVCRALVVSFKILAIGSDVVMEYRTFHIRVVILGDNHLLLRIGAANRRTITVLARRHPPRPHALNPRYFVRMLVVGCAPHLAFIRAGGTQQTFVIHAGHDVLHPAVSVFIQPTGIERLKAEGQNNRADIHLDLFRHLVQINGVVSADPLRRSGTSFPSGKDSFRQCTRQAGLPGKRKCEQPCFPICPG